MTCEERLRKLGLFRMEKLQGDLTAARQYLWVGFQNGGRLFTVMYGRRTMAITVRRQVPTEYNKNLFNIWTVKYWKGWSMKAVESLSLKIFHDPTRQNLKLN